MVNKRSISSTFAAFALFLIFPALASAHTLSVSATPAQCVTPLNGQYTATVTVTATYFGGTVGVIPYGQNVPEGAGSNDGPPNKVNQNYFTQGQSALRPGPRASPGSRRVSPRPAAHRRLESFTVTTSVPETYVLQNGWMGSPSTVTITAPTGGCAPPPPPTCPSGYTLSAARACRRPAARAARPSPAACAYRRPAAPAGRCSQAASACHRPAAPAGRSCPAVSACRRPIAKTARPW